MAALTIRVRFATNRNRTQGPDLFGPDFQDNDPKKYVTGSINVVKVSTLPDSGWTPDAKSLQIDPKIDSKTKAVKSDDQTHATGMVEFVNDRTQAHQLAAAKAGYGLVLLPGFASTFLVAMSRAAQIAHAYRAADVFCFSWPANGIVDIENYKEDERDAERSGHAVADALAHLFAIAGAIPQEQRPVMHLVAHSLGNRALRAAVQVIRGSDPGLIQHRVFRGAFLMAGDEDYDSLSKSNELGPLLQLSRHVTIYHAGGDKALTISKLFNGERLGLTGPKDLITLPETVTSVDCSDVASTQGDHGETHYGHQYYRLSARVIGDVVQVLNDVPANKISGRLADLAGSAGGRAWWLPFDANAAHGVVLAVSTPAIPLAEPMSG